MPSRQIGKCPVLKEGLPNPAFNSPITDAMITNGLLADMGTSKVSEIIGQEIKDYQKAVVDSQIVEKATDEAASSPATPGSASIVSGSAASGSGPQTKGFLSGFSAS